MIILKSEESRRQHFADLVLMQKDIEKELTEQDKFIKQFQLFAQDKDEFLSMINIFSCPIAIFERGGALINVNSAMIENTDIKTKDIYSRKINFLDRITNENYAVLEAAEGVFYGKTALLSRLSYPLQLFCRSSVFSVSYEYHSVLLFPIPDDKGLIPSGVVMLMK